MTRVLPSFIVVALLGALFAPAGLDAQRGDHAGEAQPENWRKWPVPPAPALTPEEALASFRIAPGFRIELAAAEPLIVDPIAITFDREGRLWAIELRSFMPDVDGTGETEPVGQIVVLEDDDRDGRFDRSTVFLSGLVNPRALTLVEGGVLVAEPPILWYCRDTDGDLRSDWKLELTRYGSPNPDHLEHTENGLLRNLDNWLYNAKSSRRFRTSLGPDGVPRIEEERTAFRGQWGITRDDAGRLFYNGNSSYLYGDPWPAEYLLRGAPCGRAIGQPAGIGARVVHDEAVHSVRVNVGINRGYQKGMLRDDGRLARTTSVSGGVIYRGDQFPPEFRGDAFVPEPAGNVVARFRIEERSGIPHGTQVITPGTEALPPHAFLASTDERFRPVDCANGPDGALYVVDLYRGVLQHRQFVTSYLRKQILERGLDTPVGLGRIWRIVAEDRPLDRASPGPRFASTEACLAALGSPNGWVRDRAQRLLVERGDAEESDDLITRLRTIAVGETEALARVHALWTLEGLHSLGRTGALDLVTLRAAIEAGDPRVQIAGLRVAERLAGTPHAAEAVALVARQLSSDTTGRNRRVETQAVFSLGAFEGLAAERAAIEAVRARPSDRTIALAALSGRADRQVEILTQLVADSDSDSDWPRAGEAFLGDLAASAIAAIPDRQHSGGVIADLLDLAEGATESTPERAAAILEGISRIVLAKRFPKVALPRAVTIFERSPPAPIAAHLTRLTKKLRHDGRAVAPPAPLEPLTGDARARVERGKTLFAENCAICHGAEGEGLRALGPRLAGSPRIEDEPETVVRIVLDGLTGPLEVDGEEWNTTMPGQRENAVFSDAAVAGLVTWLGRQWGHRAQETTPEEVTQIRRRTSRRLRPWSTRELGWGAGAAEGAGAEERPPTIALFDGKSLAGWSRHGGTANYTVENESIVGRTVPHSPNTFLCTERTFGDFELSYEFWVQSVLNSGVQIRSRIDENDRVRGYQVEIDVDHGRGRYWSGGIYEEGGRGWLDDLADSARARGAARSEEWNRVRVIAEGGRIRTWIRGVPTADLLDTHALEGIIGLQVHGVGKTETPLMVRWRNLQLIDRGRSAFQEESLARWIEDSPRGDAMVRRAGDTWIGFATGSKGLAAPGPIETVRVTAKLEPGSTLNIFGALLGEDGVGISGREEFRPWPGGEKKRRVEGVVVTRVGDRLAVAVGAKRICDVEGLESPPRIVVEAPQGRTEGSAVIERFEVLRKVAESGR